MDFCNKTRNRRKQSKKLSANTKNNNQLKTKRILNTEYKLNVGPIFTFSLAREEVRTFHPRQLRHCCRPVLHPLTEQE